MSDSWMAWKPRMDEPSKSWPVAIASSSKVLAGTLKCCITPRRSQNRMSMNSTPSSSMYVTTSLGLLNTSPPSAPAVRVVRSVPVPARRGPLGPGWVKLMRRDRALSTASQDPVCSPVAALPRPGARRARGRAFCGGAGRCQGCPGPPDRTRIVDWALSVVIAMLLFNYHELAVLGAFVVLNLLCISLFGATPGQFLLRVRVLPVRGRSPMPLRALVRTVLILLIITSVVWNRDAQPRQDVVAGTAVVQV